MRRFSLRDQPASRAPPAATVTRASTTTGSNNPYGRQPTSEFASLSLDDHAPPPPDYQTALRASVDLSPQARAHTQAPPPPQRTYAPPSHPPSPPAQQASRPPPPPPVAVPAPAARSQGVTRQRSVEDPLSTLGKYDVVVLVDDSPSMIDLWDETRTALMGLVERCVKYDRDGIDLYFLNHDQPLLNVTEASTIREAFDMVQPSGSTPTGYLLDEILRPYVESVEDAKVSKAKVKPLILLCLTDGRADDSDLVKDVIVEMAERLDSVRAPPFQLGIQFLQVGQDEDATAFLTELDDDLKSGSGVRDIVDTIPFEGRLTAEFILKAVLGSVVKRLDNA